MFGFNKYIVYAIIIAIVLAIAGTYVYMWKQSIRQQALLEFNNKQLEQVIKDQQRFQESMKEIEELQRMTLDEMQQRNDELNKKLETVETYLSSPETQKSSKPASDIIKNTIRQLLGGK